MLRDQLSDVLAQMSDAGLSMTQVTTEVGALYTEIALRRRRGNVSRAAIDLQVHRNTVHNILRGRPMQSKRARSRTMNHARR